MDNGYGYANNCATVSFAGSFGTLSGVKPVIVCNGAVTEADDLAKAQSIAEAQAHKHQTEAYILKPVKKVAPKREVVTTDME